MGVFNKLSIALIIPVIAFSAIKHSLAQDSPHDYLDAHNLARAQVGVCNMTWNYTVAAFAQEYAESRINGSCYNLQHSGGPYGENLAAANYPEFPGTLAVQMWVDEKQFYDYDANECVGGECRHYTQVVWRDSVQLGCAKVFCSDGFWFVTCNYYPRGNYPTQHPY